MRPLALALALACASTGACAASESARPAHPQSSTAAASGAPGTSAAGSPARACAAPPATPLAPLSASSTFPSAEFQASRDGRVAVVRATPLEIQVWNVAKGVKVATLGSTAAIDQFALRPDGLALALVSEGRLIVRDLEHGTPKTLSIDPGAVTGLRWTSDGRLLVVGRTSATDFVDPAGEKTASSLPAAAIAGGVAPDGRSLLARDGAMMDGESRAVRWKSPTVPTAAVFSDDGRSVALASEKPDDASTTITVVDVATGAKRWAVTAGGRATGIAVSRDGASVAAYDAGSDKPGAQRGVALWTRGKRVHTWSSGEDRREAHPSFSPDGTRLAFVSARVSESGSYDSRIDLVHTADGSPVRLPETPVVAPEVWSDMFAGALRWTEDGRSLLQAGRGGLSIVDATRGSHRVVGGGTYASTSSRRDVAFAPDDSAIVVIEDQADRLGTRSVARVYDLATGALRASLESRGAAGAKASHESHEFLSVEYSPDGSVIALSRVDGVLLWDGRTDRVAFVLDDDTPQAFVRFMTFAPDGRLVATYIGGGNAIHLSDPRSGKRVQTIALDDANPNDVAFSRDGSRVAVAVTVKDDRNGSHGEVRLFDPQSGALVRTLHAAPRQTSVAGSVELHWGPTGRAIVSVGSSVELWNAASDDPPETLLEGVQTGQAVLSGDGNLLAMGRTSLGVWDLRTQRLVREISGDGTPIMRTRIDPRGAVVAVVRVGHVDLYRLADGAHATLQDGDVATRASAMLMYTDDGAFMGDATAYRGLQVRDGASLVEARPVRPEELDALRRPALGADFMAGCPTSPVGNR